MLNEIKNISGSEFVVIEMTATINDARTLIDRWYNANLFYSLVLEYTVDGIQIVLRQRNKRFRIITGAGKQKCFTDTRSLYKWISSLVPKGSPPPQILSEYSSAP